MKYPNYPLDDLMFYRIEDETQLNDILKCDGFRYEIHVYKNDLDLWKKAIDEYKKINDKVCLEVVSKSIKRQIQKHNEFYGIKI